MNKLIKVSDDHFIIVDTVFWDQSERWVYKILGSKPTIWRWHRSMLYSFTRKPMTITHSTKKLIHIDSVTGLGVHYDEQPLMINLDEVRKLVGGSNPTQTWWTVTFQNGKLQLADMFIEGITDDIKEAVDQVIVDELVNLAKKEDVDDLDVDYINYRQAVALVGLGFTDIPWFGNQASLYDKNGKHTMYTNYGRMYSGLSDGYIPAPLKSRVRKWFRDKFDLFGCIDLQACTPSHWFIRIDKVENNDYVYHSEDAQLYFKSYEEAEVACIDELIKLAKEQST